jgi:nitrite reductase/ring-hydroxylating ferredoxin subunit
MRPQYIIPDMEQWVRVADISQLQREGLGFLVKADGLDVALFRWRGRVYAVDNLCPHMGFPLAESIMQGGEIICGWHGWHISLEDGTCRRERVTARMYPCEIRGAEVWLQINMVNEMRSEGT